MLILIGMLLIRLVVGKVKVRPRIIGKVATVLQMAVVLWILLHWPDKWLRALSLATAVSTGISGLLYVWDGSRQLSAHPSSSPKPKA